MTGKLYFTNAPVAYDYPYVHTVVQLRGCRWRLVAVHDAERFERFQTPRYLSGCHGVVAADSVEAQRFGLPTSKDAIRDNCEHPSVDCETGRCGRCGQSLKRRARRTFCREPRHRRQAMARARRCATCRKGPCGYGQPKPGISECLGCGRLIGYYSCAPGYCVGCAHDPCWQPAQAAQP